MRLRLNKIISHTPFFEADVSPMPDRAVDKNDQDLQDHIVALRSTSKEFVSLLQTLKLPAPVLTQLQKFLENVGLIPGQVVDLLMSTIESTLEEKVMILDAVDLKERIPKAVELLTRQIHVRPKLGYAPFFYAFLSFRYRMVTDKFYCYSLWIVSK